MSQTTQELLQPFCGISDVRNYLNSIFKKGDYLCASNGHVLVRVTDDGTVDLGADDPKNTINPDLIFKLDTWPADGFIPLEYTEPQDKAACFKCRGTGKIPEQEECDCCEGNGEFSHYDNVYSCKSCDGDGKVDTDTDKLGLCPACYGSGIGYQTLQIKDGRTFNLNYLKKLQALPGITYLPEPGISGEIISMRFKFDNGVGLLMAIRT